MKKLFYLLTCVFLFSCSEEEITAPETQETILQRDVAGAEYNKIEGPVVTKKFHGKDVRVQKKDTMYYFQGDIMMLIDGKSKDKAAAIDPDLWWPTDTIPYAINPDLPGKYRVYDAIEHYETYTNLNFVERTTEQDYIYFTTGVGCSSYIGKVGGRQSIVIGNGCSTGSTIHEIGHAAGLWHEHMRADRDGYVNILWDNIISGYEHNFVKYTETQWGGVDLTPEMDFNSIMLYGPYAFSANGEPTIVQDDGTLYTVNRQYLSEGDIYGLNIMYPADETTQPSDKDGDGISDEDDRCPEEAGTVENDGCPDSDGDGIVDIDDDCPNEAGVAEYNGCPVPDTDGDGITDPNDECPETAGVPEYNGCPVPDTDGDGIVDPEDECPNEAGTAEYNGCPEPEVTDTDGDGIPDDEDACPTEAGTAENDGCPEEEEPEYISGKIYTIAGEEVLYLDGSWYLQRGRSGRWFLVELVDGKWKKPKGRPTVIRWEG